MGAGRFICVALPFGLTVASLVFILMAMLAGITNKDFDMFEIQTQNLSISSSNLQNLESIILRRDATPTDKRHFSDLTVAALTPGVTSISQLANGVNITAKDLNLADSYKVNLWNYCAKTGSKVNCTSAKFNWASSALNITEIEARATAAAGVAVTFPKEVSDALHTFAILVKWTEIVYMIAIVSIAVELFFGLFAICSRAGSCITWIVSGFAITATVAASVMATVVSALSTGSVESTAKAFGVKASLSTSYLAVTWVGAAFIIAAGLFWMFTICCCAADHRRNNRRSRGEDRETLIPTGAYQPVSDFNHFNNGNFPGQQQGIYNGAGYGVPTRGVKPERTGEAYEPYSHAAI